MKRQDMPSSSSIFVENGRPVIKFEDRCKNCGIKLEGISRMLKTCTKCRRNTQKTMVSEGTSYKFGD